MLFTPCIDTHVHCRDFRLSYKATIKEVTGLARQNGIVAMVDMPNTDPPIIYQQDLDERIAFAEEERSLKGYYLNMGLTKDVNQIKEAAHLASINPMVVGLKYFTTGKPDDVLAVTSEEDQFKIYKTLAEYGYKGNVIPHCEKESFFIEGKFDHKNPGTWNDQRPPLAEEMAVYDQIRFAFKSRFKGHIHFPHISSPKTFDIIESFQNNLSLSGEITPHHLLYSTRDMVGEEGLDKKTNPPIRSFNVMQQLREKAKTRSILLAVGSDHAPHTLEEKRKYPWPSGHQSIKIYQNLLNGMSSWGFSEQYIRELTYSNPKKIFPTIRE